MNVKILMSFRRHASELILPLRTQEDSSLCWLGFDPHVAYRLSRSRISLVSLQQRSYDQFQRIIHEVTKQGWSNTLGATCYGEAGVVSS